MSKLVEMRLQSINIEDMEEDARPFLQDHTQLDLWSADFFRHWFKELRFE